MRIAIFSATVALLVAACAVPEHAVAPTYHGPVATIVDSYKQHSNVEADFFGVESVNGTRVKTSLATTREYNAGKGLRMTPVAIAHAIPAATVTIALWGQSTHGAPILSLMNKTYEVRGTTIFDAKPSTRYTVRGELGPSYSAVWIEDEAGAIMGNKIEKKAQ